MLENWTTGGEYLNGMVHTGFRKQVKSYCEELVEVLHKRPRTEIFCAGHSPGDACVLNTGFRFSTEQERVLIRSIIITIGQISVMILISQVKLMNYGFKNTFV